MAFATKLKEILLSKNISQSELSRKTGINRAIISEYIHGKYEPKTENLVKIACALLINPSELSDSYSSDTFNSRKSALVDPPQAKSPARGQGDITVHGNGNIINGDNNGTINVSTAEKHGEICDMYQALSNKSKEQIDSLVKMLHDMEKQKP